MAVPGYTLALLLLQPDYQPRVLADVELLGVGFYMTVTSPLLLLTCIAGWPCLVSRA
jgi:hypothetical protein